MLFTIIIFILILSFLVLIHEAGHYFTAKFFGIKVEEFGFGLPPRAWGKKIGETIYSINWLPIGGFVKLYGEDAAGGGSVKLKDQGLPKKNLQRAFYVRPVWQRAAVVFAGVFMNFTLSLVIVSILFSFVGIAAPGKNVVVDLVVKNSPAFAAGLKKGDTILSMNGIKIDNSQELVSYTKKHLGEKLNIEVKTEKGKMEKLSITPRKDYPADQGPMGIAISQNAVNKKYPIWEAPFVGMKEILNESLLIVEGLVTVVFQLFTKGSLPSDVAGPVGIAQLTGTVVSIGPSAVLSFISLLSLNLAIINVLPIPALDGGRLFFILIEGLTGKKVSPKYENYAHAIGMAVLLLLIALITLHDIFRIASGQPILPQLK